MAVKTTRDAEDAGSERRQRDKKQRKGFVVGPDNLPEGRHKLKTQQIKRSLIEKAKLKKDYAKLQAQKVQEPPSSNYPYDRASPSSAPEPTTEPHPARQTLIDEAEAIGEQDQEPAKILRQAPVQRTRRPKPMPFAREHERANKAKEEAEERRKAREEAVRQRQIKLDEREKFRKAMAKARTGGKNGQRKLGRESGVLLDKVKRIVAEG